MCEIKSQTQWHTSVTNIHVIERILNMKVKVKKKSPWWAIALLGVVLVLDVMSTVNIGVKLLNELGKEET